MPSKTDVANQALDLVNAAPISDLDGTDARSRRCKRIYEFDLPVVFEKEDWNFGKQRVSLAVIQSFTPANGWRYGYQLPDDCRRPIRINDDDSVAWAEEDGRRILTNATSPIVLFYIQDIADPNIWTASFRAAFTAYLAAHYSKAFKGGDGKGELQEYKDNVYEATTRNGQTGTPPRPTVNTLTTAIRRY